jgi:hypothetical protein
MLVISIFIFCIVLFLYLHVHFHLKRSNDLEVYEIEQPSKQRLEEVCDIRQPTTFELYNEQVLTQLSYQAIHTNYRAFDIHIRDVSKHTSAANIDKTPQKGTEDDPVLYIPVTFKIAHEVLKKDTDMKYLSENNADFIDETGLIKVFQLHDEFLRPYMVSKCMYDIMMASTGTTTPLRYEVNYRNYFLVTQGRVKILLIPPKDTRYLYPINDYELLEFRTPVNPWKVQPEYQDDFDKIKTLEVELFHGMAMFIPAYWWYSIQFIVPETSVCSFKYRTHMNTISIAPQLIMNVLQNMNTKRDTLEKRTFIKNQFQETTLSAAMTINHDTSSSSSSKMPATQNMDGLSFTAAAATPPEYTPSMEDQYLPKSLRGATNSNPYSIINAITDKVPMNDAHTPANNSTNELETLIVAASPPNDTAAEPTSIGSVTE